MIQTTDVLIVPPRDYQLRHLAVIPLRHTHLPRDRINSHCESDNKAAGSGAASTAMAVPLFLKIKQ